jgi:hypothetical protein
MDYLYRISLSRCGYENEILTIFYDQLYDLIYTARLPPNGVYYTHIIDLFGNVINISEDGFETEINDNGVYIYILYENHKEFFMSKEREPEDEENDEAYNN